MKSVVQEFLERIIHKPVALDSGQAIEGRGGNPDSKMAVQPRLTRPSVASVLITFIYNLDKTRIEPFLKAFQNQRLPSSVWAERG